MADRRVSVKLEADASQYMATLAKAAAATEALDDKVEAAQKRSNDADKAERLAKDRLTAANHTLTQAKVRGNAETKTMTRLTDMVTRAQENYRKKVAASEAATKRLATAQDRAAKAAERLNHSVGDPGGSLVRTGKVKASDRTPRESAGAQRVSSRHYPVASRNYESALAKVLDENIQVSIGVENAAKRVDAARRAEITAADRLRIATLKLNEVNARASSTDTQREASTHAVTRAQIFYRERIEETEYQVAKLDAAQRRAAQSATTLSRSTGGRTTRPPRSGGGTTRPRSGGGGTRSGGGGGRPPRPPIDPDPHFEDAWGEAAGKHTANSFGRSFEREFRQRKVFFASVIGLALTAGAPLLLASAAVLFGSIAALAGAQAAEVKEAWTKLGRDIKEGTLEDAEAMIPALTQMAADLGKSFEDIRPMLRDAFEATAPLVETFTEGITELAENSLPGMVKALERGAPVMEGFRSFLSDFGTGWSDMFSAMADHAPAAGEAFKDWGEIFGELLPLLGELLGQGAELATMILPPITGALGLMLDVVKVLGPVLPSIGAGLLAMKVGKGVAGGISGLATGLGTLATKSGLANSSGGALAKTMGAVSGAAGPAGAAIGFVAAEVVLYQQAGEAAEDISYRLGRAFRVGGDQAEAARGYISQFAIANEVLDNKVFGAVGSISLFGHSLSDLVPNTEDARRSYDEWYQNLPKGAQAAEDAAIAHDRLVEMIDKFGENSPEAIAAAGEYEAAQKREREEAEKLERAIDGVTTSMIEQADQAMAAIDKNFAYRKDVNQLEDAQKDLNDAIKEHGKGSEEAARKQLELEIQTYKTATSYGEMRAGLSNLKAGTAEYDRYVQTETLKRLYQLRDAAGPKMKVAIQSQIDMLENAGVSLDETGRKTDGAKGKVEGYTKTLGKVPPSIKTKVEAETAVATDKVSKFQHTVDNLHGKDVKVSVTADSKALAMFRDFNGVNREYSSGRAEGGPIFGPGGPTDDKAGLFRLSDGEYVVRAASVDKYGMAFMDALNNGKLAQFASGGPVPGYAGGGLIDLKFNMDSLDETVRAIMGEVTKRAASGGALGAGSVGGRWESIYNWVKARIPQARWNSTYRPGDPGYHGLGKAVDFGYGSGPGGAGSAGLALINRTLYDGLGRNLAELIYDGVGDDRADIKNGRDHLYDQSTRFEHRNHVHAAVYDQGGVLKPGLTMAYNGTGRNEFVNKQAGGWAGTPNVVVQARVFVGSREISDIARVEAEAVVVGALNETANRGTY